MDGGVVWLEEEERRLLRCNSASPKSIAWRGGTSHVNAWLACYFGRRLAVDKAMLQFGLANSHAIKIDAVRQVMVFYKKI